MTSFRKTNLEIAELKILRRFCSIITREIHGDLYSYLFYRRTHLDRNLFTSLVFYFTKCY